MDSGFTKKFAVLLITGYIFQDAISSANITIDMPSVVTVFEDEDVELECRARYANGTTVSPCKQDVFVLRWTLENDDFIAKCGQLATFKNKTVTLNADNGNLTIFNIGLSDKAVVECEVYGGSISVKNKTEIKVKKANFGVQTERNITPGEGENVMLPCSVIDSGTTDPRRFTYKWSLNNTMLQLCNKNGEVDQTSCNLTILNVNLNDEGRYRCDVDDSYYNQSNYNYTAVVLASEPLSTAATNYMTYVGSTDLKTLTLKTSQGLGASAIAPIGWSSLVLVIVVSSSGLLVIVIIPIVVALRLHTKRNSAIPKSQPNAASTASVTFRRGTSQGNAHRTALNLSSRVEDQDAGTAYADTRARVNGNQSASSPSSLLDNHRVIQHYDGGNGVVYTSVNRQKSPQASAAVYTGVTGATAIQYKPKKVARPGELVYADLQHTRQHPQNAPPIRTEPPTQYAAIRHNMTGAHRSGTSTSSGHIFDNDEEVDIWMVESEDEAPPPPPRGIFNPPLYY